MFYLSPSLPLNKLGELSMVEIFKEYLGSDSDTTIENADLLRETDKAIHIEYNEQRAWLPKSQIKIDYGKSLKITMPEWLFKKKFG